MTPVTVIEAGPCPVVAVRTPDVDGYTAVQLAFRPCKEKKLTRPRAGHLEGRRRGPAPHADRVPQRRRGPRTGRHGHRRGVRARARRSRCRASPRARASQAPSSGTNSTAARSATARTTSESRARSAPRRTPRACSRGSRWRARWGTSGSPSAACASPTSTPSGTCSWCGAPSPGPIGGVVEIRSERMTPPAPTAAVITGGAKAKLAADVFALPRNDALVHQVVTAELAARRQGTPFDQDPRPRRRRAREAVAPEGHRPRPPGHHPRAAVDGRRRRVRPASAQLHRQGQQEGARQGALDRALRARRPTARSSSPMPATFDEPKTKKAAELVAGARPRDAARGRDGRGRGRARAVVPQPSPHPCGRRRRARGRRGRLGALARRHQGRARRCSRGARHERRPTRQS